MVQEVELYEHQKKGVAHILKHPRSALWMECGLGKTLTTIEALKKLPKPIIVMAPKRVALHTWPEELGKWWPEATYRQLSTTPAKRAKALQQPADIYLINFELVAKLIGDELNGKWPWPTVVVDESTKIKNRATKLFKALRKVAGKWKHLVELTGTPSPNGLGDLWSQVYLLDRGERLGKTLTAFRDKWFVADYMGWNYEPRANAQKEIEERVKDICLSMTAKDYLNLPDMMVDDVPVALPTKAEKVYRQLKKDLTLEVQSDQFVTATTAAVLTNKLLQCTAGTVYDEEGEAIKLHTEKVKAVQDIIDTIGDESLLIVYQFRHELELLREALPELVEVRDRDSSIDDWNNGAVKLMAIHPASAGHGLNLQKGGRHIVWTTPTWNLEHYQQTNARLHRNGQTKPVIVYRLIVPSTVDGKVAEAIKGKAGVQALLMEALK